jgi:methyl-accepting chemotaxis protein
MPEHNGSESGQRSVSPSGSGTALLWSSSGRVANVIKNYTPEFWQRTLNRQLWVHAFLATGVPLLYAGLVLQSLEMSLLLVFLTFGAGGFIYGEMYLIIKNLQQSNELIRDGEYNISIEEDRSDEIDKVYRGIEAMGRDLKERIDRAQTATDEAEDARDRAQEARQEAEQARNEAEQTAAALREQARQYSQTMDTVAAGDLTRRLDDDVESEAMAEIAASFNQMLDSLEETIGDVDQFAETVSAATEQAASNGQEIERVSEDVSKSVQEIANDAEYQETEISGALEELNDLSATIEEIASSATSVADRMESAAETGRQSQQDSAEAIEEVRAIETEATNAAEEMAALDAQIEQISEVVDLIDDIAEQTNMLALNASIEAARAGEAGDGFAVVADEIKSLATETSEATDEVETLIAQMRTQADTAVGRMDDMKQRVDRGGATIEGAIQSIEEIVDSIEAVNTGVQDIDSATDRQAKTTEQVVATMDELTDVGRETAERARSASRSAQQQTDATAEMTGTVQSLADEAADLQSVLDELQTSRRRVTAD